MKRIAKFHKVSKERFTADWIDTFAQSQEEQRKYTKQSACQREQQQGVRVMISLHRQNLHSNQVKQ